MTLWKRYNCEAVKDLDYQHHRKMEEEEEGEAVKHREVGAATLLSAIIRKEQCIICPNPQTLKPIMKPSWASTHNRE